MKRPSSTTIVYILMSLFLLGSLYLVFLESKAFAKNGEGKGTKKPDKIKYFKKPKGDKDKKIKVTVLGELKDYYLSIGYTQEQIDEAFGGEIVGEVEMFDKVRKFNGASLLSGVERRYKGQ